MENFLKEFKATDFEVDYDNQVINLTYDCGDLEDAEHFESKVIDASKEYGLTIYTSFCDGDSDSDDEELEQDDEWTIVEVQIDCGDFNTINKKKLKEFIMFVDTI